MPKENFFKLRGIDSPPKLGGDASAASGEVPFCNQPRLRSLLLRLRPIGLALRGSRSHPKLGGDLHANRQLIDALATGCRHCVRKSARRNGSTGLADAPGFSVLDT